MSCLRFFRVRPSFGFAGNTLLLGLLLAIPASILLSTPVAAAQDRGPVQRVVQGKVSNKADKALPGAIVYLKNMTTLGVKSYIVAQDGAYRFGQLSQDADYQVWAELNGKKSDVRTISSFDNRKQFYINLQIDTGK
ncbi:MAG: carboxypeptidase-like regulatory domain-containing protein [Acidobacteriaceae bacterium]